MIWRLASLLLITATTPLAAQMQPRPEGDRQRIQAVQYVSGQDVMLTMLPGTPLTVVMEPGDRISDVAPGPEGGFSIRVSAERDSFTILPLANDARSELAVTTRKRSYSFLLNVGDGPEAAVLVRYIYQTQGQETTEEEMPRQTWRYRLRGDREVRPLDISDNGIRTRISYAPGQALPAVFAIGPSGDEEVVDGYMRDGIFEIDRVHDRLVFRIDKEKATARRNAQPEAES